MLYAEPSVISRKKGASLIAIGPLQGKRIDSCKFYPFG
jgi:hypothetical protein